MAYIYVITEDAYFLCLRSTYSDTVLHDTIGGVNEDMHDYFINRELSDGYRPVGDLEVSDCGLSQITFSKWFGILKRVITIKRQPVKK